MTISIGVARRRPGEPSAAFVERADAALYASKRDGRNRITYDGDRLADRDFAEAPASARASRRARA